MPYEPPSVSELRQSYLDGYSGIINGAVVDTTSEVYARASGAAAAAAALSHGCRYVEDQIFPDTADSGNLERHAGVFERTRKAATQAESEQVRLTGTSGLYVGAGLYLVRDDDGVQYQTTTGGTISAGVLDVEAEAVDAGADGNFGAGGELAVQSPPIGLDATATTVDGFSGGTDVESNDDLADWVLQRWREGNAGGRDTDYELWALEVHGVLEAHVLPLRNGPGTVTIAAFSLGGSGWRTPAGASLLAAVDTAVQAERPVTAEVDVVAATEVALDISITGLQVAPGFDYDTVKAEVADALEAWVYANLTGDTAYRSQIGRTVGNVNGVEDYTVALPATNVAFTVDSTTVEVMVPGTITVAP